VTSSEQGVVRESARRGWARTRALVLALAAAACGGGGGGGGDDDDDGTETPPDAAPVVPCPIGDVAAPIELEVVHLDGELQTVDTEPGAEVPLFFPPQGGWILQFGVRARNVDGCRLNLKTSLNDACDGTLLEFDQRPTVLDENGEGWGVSKVTHFSALQTCPLPNLSRNGTGEPYDVTVTIEDLVNGKQASASMQVVPRCPADAPRCRCECRHDYVLGEECPAEPDGGPEPDAGPEPDGGPTPDAAPPKSCAPDAGP
jgi:hypothetical protein